MTEMFPNDGQDRVTGDALEADLALSPTDSNTIFAPDEIDAFPTFKVWVEFDPYGQPKQAAWGMRPPAGSVIQIETQDVNTARRTTAALKASIRDRYSDSQVLGAALSGVY